MSLDRSSRNALAAMVGKARERLKIDVMGQLRRLGFQNDGTVLDLDRIGGLSEGERAAANELRALLDHFAASEAGSGESDTTRRKAAYDRMAREIGFTTLNRLVALRMAEERGLIVQAVGAGFGSRGFQVYERVAGSALGSRIETYRAYLECLYDEIARDLPVLFDRTDPQSRIFPSERCLEDVLALLNDPALVELWGEDETIGWVYQYYNDPDERKKMRESQAPRTSRELAVRNQFFTPRYVVEFLTDNTLGRLWFEMRKGDTRLVEQCAYLVRRKHTIFLAKGQQPPAPFDPSIGGWGDPDALGEMWTRPNPDLHDLHDIMCYALTVGGYEYARRFMGEECQAIQGCCRERYQVTGKWEGSFEELRCALFMEQRAWHHWGYTPEGEWTGEVQALYRAVCSQWDLEAEYVPYRAPQHPRRIKVLDPACGSCHFLLYAFDLLATMYEEAEPELPRHEIPAQILRYNLHGIDIDPRAVQIAGLALYLKARKYDREARVGGMNIVCAAPMPGERRMFEEFLARLNSPTLARIAGAMWDELKLASVAGSLLKPEQRLHEVVAEQRKMYQASSRERQLALLPEYALPEQLPLDFSDVTDDSFWDMAGERIVAVLRDYSEQTDDNATTRHLFAEDSMQGFRFVDLMRKRYDIVLMNPPFGEGVVGADALLEELYPRGVHDLFAMFVERGLSILHPLGRIGAITNRTGFFLSRLKQWRQDIILSSTHIEVVADLGLGVLDKAMVETAAYVLSRTLFELPKPRRSSQPATDKDSLSLFIRLLKASDKEVRLREVLSAVTDGSGSSLAYLIHQSDFRILPGVPFPYWVTGSLRSIFATYPPLEGNGAEIRQGLATADDFRFIRTCWEVGTADGYGISRWIPFAKGGEYSPYYADVHLVLDWGVDGNQIKAFASTLYNNSHWSRNIRNVEHYFRPGLTFPRRTKRLSPSAFPRGCIFSHAGQVIFPSRSDDSNLNAFLALTNSRLFYFLIQLRLGSAGGMNPQFEVGVVQTVPIVPMDEYARQRLNYYATECHDRYRYNDQRVEAAHAFTVPFLLVPLGETLRTSMQAALTLEGDNAATVASSSYEADALVLDIYGIGNDDRAAIDDDLLPHPGSYPDDTSRLDEARFRQAYLTKEEVSGEDDEGDSAESVQDGATETGTKGKKRVRYRDWEELAHLFKVHPAAIARCRADLGLVRPEELAAEVERLLSYLVGVAFGRWDARIGKNPAFATTLGGAFDQLPVCSPGMLTEDATLLRDEPLPYRPERLPAKPEDLPTDYPLAVQWSGLLVDDPEHPDDLVRRARDVLVYLWEERAPAIEEEIRDILKLKDLRDYFRRPALFFANHLSQYSKSRRQVPIYWPLSTASGSYTLWLYYPRLTSDTLYTAVNRYVEPKIAQVQREVSELEDERDRASGREAARLRDRVVGMQGLRDELLAFRDELLRVAALPYRPNLNDGVIINAAPLHRLFRLPKWAKDTKECWTKLERGEYDWAHLAYTIWPDRVREKCCSDKSLAIAHGLEELYVEPTVSTTKRKKRI